MNEIAEEIGRIAANAVALCGGSVTFDQYDQQMKDEFFLTPIEWGLPPGTGLSEKRYSTTIMAVAQAVRMGLLRQTKTGYELVRPNAVG